jgi:hypothetical protein
VVERIAGHGAARQTLRQERPASKPRVRAGSVRITAWRHHTERTVAGVPPWAQTR